MISASHNPYEDNGLKLFGADGYKLSDEVENQIQVRMENGPLLAKSPDLGRARRMEDGIGRYIEFIKQVLSKREDLTGMKVVLDCANGAGYKVGPEVFFELGAEVVTISTEPNGKNINYKCGAMFPDQMAEKTKLQLADLGIALDGDADRVVFSDEEGQIIHGDHIIAVLAKEMKLSKQLLQNQVIGTTMSNLGLEIFLDSININLHRTNIGDRYILDEMIKSKTNLGGEPSGHILLTDYAKTGDGLLTAIKIISLLKKSGLKASQYLRPFKLVPQSLKNIRNIDKNILQNNVVKQIILNEERRLGVNGRVLVRASGTEDLIRIMVESKNQKEVQEIIENIASTIIEQNNFEKDK
jgi:phosphoglucosamine mutase